MEGNGFRDGIQDFIANDVQILGVSFDSAAENKAFHAKHELPFPLLCDTERMLGVAYGACDEPTASHAKRITIVIDAEGNVARLYNKVDPRSHPKTVLEDLKAAHGDASDS